MKNIFQALKDFTYSSECRGSTIGFVEMERCFLRQAIV